MNVVPQDGDYSSSLHEEYTQTSLPQGFDHTPTDLYAFGNIAGPRPPRIMGYNRQPGQDADLILDHNGMVGPTNPPRGASTFADPNKAPVRGHYHRLPAGTRLPRELGYQGGR